MGIYHKIKNLIKNLTKIRITEQIIKKFPKKRNNCSLLSGTGPGHFSQSCYMGQSLCPVTSACDTGPGGSESPAVEAAAYIRPEGHDQPWWASVSDNTRP